MKEIEDGLVQPGISSAITGVRGGDLAALLARVEKAEGPDRELDALLEALAQGLAEQPNATSVSANEDGSLTTYFQGRKVGRYSARDFTGSLDMAMALCVRVLPGWRPRIDNRGLTPGHEWLVTLAWWEKRRFAWGRTAPLALIAAMLKALNAGEAS